MRLTKNETQKDSQIIHKNETPHNYFTKIRLTKIINKNETKIIIHKKSHMNETHKNDPQKCFTNRKSQI